jgi:iron(III) transport system ATP-binding protein
MNHPSLEARNISRTFGTLKAVNDVSLCVSAGQVVALLGKSGSGKSTLLRLFAGLESVDCGEILASGECVSRRHHLIAPEQRGLGMVFQDYALFPHLTALGNVAFGLQKLGKAQAGSIAREWLHKVGLGARAGYFPHQLSGGEQQRVALARALAPGPKAILMDEPFSGLDPHLRADLQRTMLAALRGAGVAALIVSHDTEEALGIADQVAVMDEGCIIQTGPPSLVYNAPVSLEAARALGAVWIYRAHAIGGSVTLPFGTYPTSLSGNVIIAARPDATGIMSKGDGRFTVTDVRGVGRFVTVTLTQGDQLVQARIIASTAPQIGTMADITLAPADTFIFADSSPNVQAGQ